ncbi:(2Fe-2S) ferredoxin domain-containing protein [Gordonia sp. (in: high G+C Gram-positive bacteria)]|uniref:(2Fe-2S) ferredoxin domain-containing protein n=1 Tax=unclassified Gordonia (in: high G+C Gram-positive bacteria) TaxID=2657482 RepID=UPI0026294331|nr:(2Fe-2S) ferredoxin domain-containing protein [Gordonia sp. (in: high G+C Gram-positive bacteria)]
MTADWVTVTAPTDRGDAPARALTTALGRLRAARPDIEFRVAVLGGSDTTITEALDDATGAGARAVLLISGQTLGDAKQDSWIARIVGHWLRTRPAGTPTPQVRVAPLLTDHDGFAGLLERAIDDGGTPARTTTAPILSPAWEQVPAFTRHVLVCRGPRCSVEGARESAATLSRALADRGLGDDDVLTTVTGCLFPCALAPVMAVYPDGTWYSGMRPDRVERLVVDHLAGGEPVAEWIARDLRG